MPANFSRDTQLVMAKDRQIKRCQILAYMLFLPVHALGERTQGRQTLRDDRMQVLFIHVIREREGEVERIRIDGCVAEAGVSQDDQFTPALWRDGVDGARGKAPRLRLLDGLDQPLLFHAV